MARTNSAIYSLNGGAVSRLALTRIDLNQLTICEEVLENWLASTLGWVGVRPGTQLNGSILANAKPQYLRFIGTASASSLLELTPNALRVWNDDAPVTRIAVGSTIVNGAFPSLTGWTVTAPGGGAVTSDGTQALILGTGLAASRLTQAVTIPAGSSGAEHGLRIVVGKGPITLKIGTISGSDDIVGATDLAAGTHSLSVVLSGTVYIDFSASSVSPRALKSVAFEAAGVMTLPTPWGSADIGRVRYDQQGDVLFCATRTSRQQRIESRSRRSWSVVDYLALDGPFLPIVANQAILTPNGTIGNIVVSSDRPLFQSGHVGAIFEITHSGQSVTATINGENQFSDPIRVTGVGASRAFGLFITGAFSGTVTLQSAVGAPEAWRDAQGYTASTSTTFNDTLDNSIIYYRLGFKTGNYVSGAPVASLIYAGGTTVGSFRVSAVNNSQSVNADVIKTLGAASGATSWREGAWSAFRGWPRSVAFQDGRLWWLGKNLLYGSVSDSFSSYDDTIEGDSAPVVRSIATGPADGNLWIVRLFRLIVASATSITGIRSSSLDEPITKTAFTARDIDQTGASDLAPSAMGGRGVFVGRSNIDLYEITPSADIGDYAVSLLNRLNPSITASGVVKIAIQRRPEPRVWCVLGDGTMAVLTYNREEKVIAWQTWRTDGFVEECEILPNIDQDDVFLCVNRLLNGVWTRRMERCSYEKDTVGGVKNHVSDCARRVVLSSPAKMLTGLDDFNGKTVSVWTTDRRGYRIPVADGVAVLPSIVSEAWVGLSFDASLKSTKLAYAADLGTALLQKKRIDHIGIAFDTTARIGVKVGRSFDTLDPLPMVRKGEEIDPNIVEDDIDEVPSSFNGTWDSDSRFCIQGQSPWPCRVKAVTVSITTHDAR